MLCDVDTGNNGCESFICYCAGHEDGVSFGTNGFTVGDPLKIDADFDQPTQEPVEPQSAQTVVTPDGKLTRFAIPAGEEDPDEVMPPAL